MAFAGLFGGVFERSAERYEDGAPVPSVKDHPHIHTPEFKAWFGDWTKRKPGEHSHVVHPETGKPLRVYHGTLSKNSIDAFSPSSIGTVNALPDDSVGYYFTDSAKVSNLYNESPRFEGQTIPAYLSLKNPHIDDMKGGYWHGRLSNGMTASDLKANGRHDGIILRNVIDGGKDQVSNVYIAFHPHQIKSATGNRGTYDPKDPRIHYNDEAPVLFGGLFDGVFRYAESVTYADGATLAPVAKKIVEPHPRSTVHIMTGHEVPQTVGTGPHGRKTGYDISKHLDQRSLARGGEMHGYDATHQQHLATALADEAHHALKQDKNAIGWYDSKIKEAMSHMKNLHPEFSKDKHKSSLFKAILAITSGGADVHSNFARAHDLYSQWKNSGTFDTAGTYGGEQMHTINGNLSVLKDLLSKHGLQKTIKLLRSKVTAGDLKRMGHGDIGENVGTKVRGAMMFGPKIGAFFSNLHGDYSPVTMDRWFMRTINRMRGKLTSVSPEAAKAQAQSLHDVISSLHYRDDGLHGHSKASLLAEAKKVASTGDISHAKELAEWTKKQFRNYSKDFSVKTNANKASKNFHDSLYGQNISPANGGERDMIRSVVGKAQEILKSRGVHIHNADLQALLWYYEKELWGKLGYTNKRSQAADYADAARRLVQQVTNANSKKLRVASA